MDEVASSYMHSSRVMHLWYSQSCSYLMYGTRNIEVISDYAQIIKPSPFAWLVGETGYKRWQTSKIKTTLVQFMLETPWRCTRKTCSFKWGITVTLLSKWKLSSQLNKKPKRLKKNLKKFRLDQESNSDSCDDRTQRWLTLYPVS